MVLSIAEAPLRTLRSDLGLSGKEDNTPSCRSILTITKKLKAHDTIVNDLDSRIASCERLLAPAPPIASAATHYVWNVKSQAVHALRSQHGQITKCGCDTSRQRAVEFVIDVSNPSEYPAEWHCERCIPDCKRKELSESEQSLSE